MIATWNRSAVLGCALESVRGQTRPDWEARVVGDACTDDTAEVVASLGDPRIHFENLETNFGEQSHPNNVGASRARGRYLAFLNHDDLWFPDHLEACVARLEETGADLVFAARATAQPRSPEELEAGDWRFRLWAAQRGRYEPYVEALASTWVMRRELYSELGGMRPAVACWGPSSLDLLYRAWKAKHRMLLSPRVTVLTFPSPARPGCYVEQPSFEQRFFLDRMGKDPGLRERIVEIAALAAAGREERQLWYPPPRRRLQSWLYPLFLRLGWNPRAIGYPQLYGFRRRNYINALRRTRGLGDIDG